MKSGKIYYEFTYKQEGKFLGFIMMKYTLQIII